jgi:hypothetical protein
VMPDVSVPLGHSTSIDFTSEASDASSVWEDA